MSYGLSDIRILTSSSLDFTSTGVKFKFAHTVPFRVKRWGILLSAAPGDAGVVQLRKAGSTGTATVLSTINLLTTHAAHNTVYAELVAAASVGIGTLGAFPLVTGDFRLDINVSDASASISAEYVVIEVSFEPAEPSANTLMTVTT